MRLCFLISCLFLNACFLFSQYNYRIVHWGIEHGLSQGINQKIIQDVNGFLWVTSYEGLNHFDGKVFRNYYSYPKKEIQYAVLKQQAWSPSHTYLAMAR